jgi:hypothetical protein
LVVGLASASTVSNQRRELCDVSKLRRAIQNVLRIIEQASGAVVKRERILQKSCV